MDSKPISDETIHEVEYEQFLKPENLNDMSAVHFLHQQRLLKAEEDVEKLKKFIKDYEDLRSKLVTLPDKSRYEAIVPFGTVAFMRGHIVHTNEVLALLGEDWFAEISCKQAVAVVNRRLQVCEESLRTAESAKRLHQGWVDTSENILSSGKIDLTETVTEAEYQKSKKERKRRAPIEASDQTDEQFMKRLQELEMREDQLDELAQSSSDTETEESGMEEDDEGMETGPLSMQTDQESILSFRREKLQRRVSWADQLSESQMDTDQTATHETPVVKYTTCATMLPEEGESQQATPTEQTPPLVVVEEEACAPSDPADVYRIYRSNSVSQSSQPKGILKNTLSNPSEEQAPNANFDSWYESMTAPENDQVSSAKAPLSESAKEIKARNPAFTRHVVAMDEDQPDVHQPAPTQERKVSRFKAAKMKN